MVLLPRYSPRPQRRGRLYSLFLASRHRWRRIFSIILIFYIFTIYNRRKHPFSSRAHIITPSDILFESQLATSDAFLPVAESKKLCAAHKWLPYPNRGEKRKIYDLIMLNTELDWLEIRLETMSAHVSYFVILESAYTFTGLEKPLTLKNNWARFEKFHGQIIYKVVGDMPIGASRTWDLEDFQRNAMLTQGVLSTQDSSQRAKEGDVLIVADVDEIVRPATLLLLRECDIPPRVTIRSRFYYYGFQWEHRGEEWAHPQATVFKGKNTILPADLRNGEGGNRLVGWWDKTDLWNAGWHCSSCFETIGDLLNKMKSFSHTSLNQEQFREKERIVNRVRKGLDLWDRQGELYDRRENNADIPEFLKREWRRFGYLLDRDGPDAGFTDYGSGETAAGE